MIKNRKKWRKGLLIGLGTLFGLFLILILCLSPFLKHLLEKNDEKWFGRQVNVGWVYANPITGFVHLDHVKIFENKSDSIFMSLKGLDLRFDMVKLFSNEFVMHYITLIEPSGLAIQYTKTKFNFSDIIEKFSGEPQKKGKPSSESKFRLSHLNIENGTFYLRELITPVSYHIKDVNIRSTWSTDSVANVFDFNSGLGSGKFEGHLTLNRSTLLYRSHIIIRRLDLKIIEQYLKDLSRDGKFRALINLDITADGDMKDGRNINAVGGVGIYDFHFGRTEKEDFASFKKFVIKINHLNPRKKIYEIDSMSLVTPFVRYEKYDYLDNVQHMFGEKGSKLREAERSEKFNLVIVLADYIKLLATNFFNSSYKINRVGIYRADVQFHDYSPNEKFAIALNPLTITADSLGSNKDRVHMKLASGIKPFGDVHLHLSINPQDSSDFELTYHLQKINAAVANPYLLKYTSYPFNRGSIDLRGNWRVRNGEITSTNRLLVIDPRLANRTRTNNNKWLPLKLFMFVARDRGNAIDYEIPISGNLKDPNFHYRDVLFDAFTNILVKPATTRYRHEIKNIENQIENSIGFNWEPGSADLLEDQEKYLRRITSFLEDNPAARIAIFPNYYESREKEYIGLFEAKKKYFLLTNIGSSQTLKASDSIQIARTSPKDSLFTRYMRRHVNDSALYTTQQLCSAFVGADLINKKYSELQERRKERFFSYFSDEGLRSQVKLQKARNTVPFNGFSFYQVSYNGTISEDMTAAFEDLLKYDNEWPRKKFKDERRKTRRFFNSRKKEKA